MKITTEAIRTLAVCACLMAVAGGAAAAPDWNASRLIEKGLRAETLEKARNAYLAAGDRVGNTRIVAIIDYGMHSSKPRLFLIDTEHGTQEALLVSHGRGSDPDHDGWADRFSNVEGSKMSSLGAYLTRNVYYGKHGMSLRLVGLDASNDRALERAIVMHGADYVAPGLAKMGRSWGCPAIQRRHVARLLPKLAGGAFLYIAR
jgi:hypothetical protein